ncbi:glycosyltransferase family 2 protein [Chthonobacter albigriseus]|uniref:glycosyltransferase family 2 protein n=1 Tax=Chthonobacter albigriseus TaxID=1683161 RepID=UPI0019D538D0|nr:glycosyltransferase family 2 protein [Chthonobacter albigriseus]
MDIVVVNFRTPDLTIRCVKSVLQHCDIAPSQVVIVDNNSGDGSADAIAAALPDCRTLARDVNDGFGAGVNAGAELGHAGHILVLNPDTYFEDDSVSRLLGVMRSNYTIGLAGFELVNPDGTRQYSARRFYSLLDVAARRSRLLGALMKRRLDRHLMRDMWTYNRVFDAEWVMGSGFIVRRDVFEKIGEMDVGYFLYMEDVDLCARVWHGGYRVVCVPGAKLVHDHQRASAASPFSFAGRKHLESLLRFASKYRMPVVRQPGVEGAIGHPLTLAWLGDQQPGDFSHGVEFQSLERPPKAR